MRILKAIPAVPWLASIALAVPHDKQKAQNVDVMVQQIKATSEMDITVVSQDSSQVLGYACSNILNSGVFAEKPITATLDENGAGTLAVGNQMYIVNEDPETSGGITCSRTYNDVESFILCAVSLPASLPLTPIRSRDKTSCFSSGNTPSLQAIFRSILAQNKAPETEITNIIQRDEPPTLHKRQAPCGQWSSSTQIVGDGDPHQNYLHTQLSENVNCGEATSCTVGQTESISYTIGWSATATAFEWLTGGFSVSVSWTTGNTYSCTGSSNDTVCVWYNTAHTAYTVQNGAYNDCTGFSPSGGTLIMRSPNSNNVGGGYNCIIGTSCSSQGANYWDYNGPAGGPQ
ncbi:hypothetical protein N7474_003014 [Penicillium riverlandense]|uniref:uncharacterized protein n=1 Tax=Penicillium riverlandense TaxID=1903569 RepID=UPI0025496AEE|nr:uncharacterized protein N7474_003014 [Penicillium riverlandense]KAJ5825876.1 hypothetical protein N7474_003014 [Penicillium riverlandense]